MKQKWLSDGKTISVLLSYTLCFDLSFWLVALLATLVAIFAHSLSLPRERHLKVFAKVTMGANFYDLRWYNILYYIMMTSSSMILSRIHEHLTQTIWPQGDKYLMGIVDIRTCWHSGHKLPKTNPILKIFLYWLINQSPESWALSMMYIWSWRYLNTFYGLQKQKNRSTHAHSIVRSTLVLQQQQRADNCQKVFIQSTFDSFI